MARKIGFSDDSLQEGQSRSPHFVRRVLFPSVVLCVMGGMGGAIALKSLGDGQIIGFAVGIVWCVALVTWGASKLIKALLGIDRPRKAQKNHDWTLDGEDQ